MEGRGDFFIRLRYNVLVMGFVRMSSILPAPPARAMTDDALVAEALPVAFRGAVAAAEVRGTTLVVSCRTSAAAHQVRAAEERLRAQLAHRGIARVSVMLCTWR